MRVALYFQQLKEQDRWIPGDRFIRPLVRQVIRGKPGIGGVGKVFVNLCRGLDRLGVSYTINLPFRELRDGDWVGVLGRGRHCLDGYDRPYPIVAGIGLMTHPSEWPTLCEDYPVVRYLQHSEWTANVYRPYYGNRCEIWPVGIDTDFWLPIESKDKRYDFLIYDKIMWNYTQTRSRILLPIQEELQRRGLTYIELRYGHYKESDFRVALSTCNAMIFLCEHESQGLAYLECLASDVPILAWDQGWYLDPNRFRWGQPEIPATSVPYFSDHCGVRFPDVSGFPCALDEFLEKQGRRQFAPRSFIIENLSLEKCSAAFIDILEGANNKSIDR